MAEPSGKADLKVLITVPHLHLNAGVTNYFEVIRNHFSITADFFCLGAASERENIIKKFRQLGSDRSRIRGFLYRNSENIDLIHINPSFRYAALVRDGLILKEAKRFGKKTLIFFHGWSHGIARIVDKYFHDPFFSVYNRADAFVVLASEFKRTLESWGFKQPIYLETTPVDDALINGFSIAKRIRTIKEKERVRLLFLSRIETQKGIRETLEALNKRVAVYPNMRLVVAGDGTYLHQARQMAIRLGLKDKVQFLGSVKGGEKKEAFRNSDIYVLPTYGEGMPTSVLEAMAFGLPVVTRSVGGLKDFFIDEKFGFMTESKDPCVFASLIGKIICDRHLMEKMSVNCHNYAKERFLASKVARRLENIYSEVVSV
jgi:glycosyltransferase involved in cell wall biosynthesis